MAAFLRRVGRSGQISWQAKVRLNGVYRSKTFVKKSDAAAWATSVENTINEGKPVQQRKQLQKTLADIFDDYLAFLEPRLEEARRVLKGNGSLFFHIDYREVHYAKVLLDTIFGRDSFLNEIIWAYDYGARSKTKWPAKHDNILWYAKNPEDYQFHLEECDRIPYMAPGLVGPEKAANGKTPTDTWWHTIVSPNGHEKTGYPTQKPRGVLDRIVKVHSRPGDLLLDFFAGSGSFGEAAVELGRRCILVDTNEEALRVMEKRFAEINVEWVNWTPEAQHDAPVQRRLFA